MRSVAGCLLFAASGVALALLVPACSGHGAQSAFSDVDSAAPPGSVLGSVPGNGESDGGAGDEPNAPSLGDGAVAPTPSDCTAAAQLVYVIDEQGGLHSFDPGTLQFKTIGMLDCPGGGMTFNSMAVDRNATAWVNDISGNLFKVDTSNASCEATQFVAPPGFEQLGMGFATDIAGGTTETLFVDGIGGSGLATIDLTTMKLTPIGMFTGAESGLDCELTGTSNAQLFGFFTTTPASVDQVDEKNASILSTAPQAGVNTGTDWAFSAWGGDFYLYTADTTTNPNDTTNVTRYRPSNKTTTVVRQQIGFRIVGAGVSTCAPTTTPM